MPEFDSEYWRYRAQLTRELARRQLVECPEKEKLLLVAKEYEKLAKRFDELTDDRIKLVETPKPPVAAPQG